MTGLKRARATPLLLALLLSTLAHALTLASGWLRVPVAEERAAAAPLLARLEPMQTAPVMPAPVSRVVAAKPARGMAQQAQAALRTDAPAPWVMPIPETDTDAEDALPEVVVAAAQSESPAAEPVRVATTAPGIFIAEPEVTKALPRRGRISYNAIFKGFNAGTSELSWEAIMPAYQIDSKTIPQGLARLVSPLESMQFHSSGHIGEAGLLPQQFRSREVRRGVVDEAEAQFNWHDNQIQFGRVNTRAGTDTRQNAALTASSQDMMSMMLQLSFAPPMPGRLMIPVTNGKNFENRELEVLAEETLKTPMGPLRVLPVKEVQRPGSESREIYLATEYRYLPVSIRFMGRDGALDGELMVTSIHVE